MFGIYISNSAKIALKWSLWVLRMLPVAVLAFGILGHFYFIFFPADHFIALYGDATASVAVTAVITLALLLWAYEKVFLPYLDSWKDFPQEFKRYQARFG